MSFVSRILEALPPLSLVWRRIRPVLTGLGIATWILYRSVYCFWNDYNSPSLWTLLVVPWKAAWKYLRQQLFLLFLFLLRSCGIIGINGNNPIEDPIRYCQQLNDDDDRNTNLQPAADVCNDEFTTVGDKLLNWIQLVVEDLLFWAMISTTLRWIYLVTSYCTRSSWNEWQTAIVHWIYTLVSEHVPSVQLELQRQGAAFRAEAQQVKQQQRSPDTVILWKLPNHGRSYQSILDELMPAAQVEREHSRWHAGKQSGTVYYPPSEDVTETSAVSVAHSNKSMSHSQFLSTCYALYSEANPLHYGCWPRVQQCEAEVITMVGDLLHAPSPTYGCLTSGGTESIVLAIRAQAAYFGRYVAHPELIAATTAHAAVRKACELFGIRLVQVQVVDRGDYPFQLTPDLVRPYMTANTVMIYASAPCYPQGVVDDIVGLGELALRHNVGLHVDACLGGFVLPFWRDGVQFDFSASKGVTSMSIDTHKYGMAAKGTSVVLYRHSELRHAQYFSYADWTGGLYATPTLAGSRPGGLSVAAWASLVSLGWDGLQDASDRIREAVKVMVQGIGSIDGIKVLGKKQYMVVCFCVDHQNDKHAAQLLDIYSIKDHMSEAYGWNLNDLQNPACVHLCVTLSVAPLATEFVENLRDSVAHVRQQNLELIQKGKPIQKRGMAAIYGTVQSVPAGSVEYLLKCYTDETLAP